MQVNSIFKTLLFALFCCHLQTNALQAQQWERVNALPSGQFTALFATGDTLFAAGLNTVFQSFDGGETWQESSVISPTLDFINSITYNRGRLYVGTVVDGVYSSIDGGQIWQADNSGLVGLGALNISSFAVRGDSLYTGTYGAGVFVKKISTNSAWSSYNQGMPWYNIESVSSANGHLFAGAGGNGTYSIQKAPGASWEEISFASFNGLFNAFLGLVVEGDTWIAGGSLGLYKSVDQGKNWTYYNPGTGLLGSARFSKSGNRIIANLAKPVGLTYLFFTDDQGATWKNLEPTLTGSYGYDLIHCKNHLYSARDNGLWRLTITSGINDEISVHPVLGQNFPNPFVGKTVIPVDLQETGNVELLILDGTGNPVRRLFAEAKTVGRQYFDVDLNGLAPGIYMYRLTAGGYQESRSMLLLR